MGYGDVGFNGCPDIPTPHIDSIAAAGASFTDGYVSAPACSPSRAGLLTARYQQRFGHEFNPGPPLSDDVAEGALPLSEHTIADMFKDAGYATVLIGKWHLGSSKRFWPLERGFEEFYGFLGGNHPYIAQEEKVAILRGASRASTPGHLTESFGSEAAGIIKRSSNRPFFLCLSFNAVHTPLQPDPKHLARFAGIADPRRRAYAALVAGMDEAVGKVLAALRSARQEDNTLIVFLSDNGGPQYANGSRNAPLRGDKLTLWEGGIRVPFAMQWKGTIPADLTFEHPVISLDAAATALAAAGVTLGGPTRAVDGADLLPYLLGKITMPPHDSLYWRFGAQHAVRQGNWKLLQFEKGPTRLYDLKSDIGETNNQAAKHPDIVKRLHDAYVAWDAQMIDPLWKRHRMETRPVRISLGCDTEKTKRVGRGSNPARS
jgi:arylsulfatase A-like enzyme